MIGLLGAIEHNVSPAFRVLISGRERVYIEGVTAFGSYSHTQICLSVGKTVLTVVGEELTIEEMDRGELTVRGSIARVDLQ